MPEDLPHVFISETFQIYRQ